MPITKSVKKSLRVSQRRRQENRRQEIGLKKALKEASDKNLNKVISQIDKAAKTHLIHKNKAARLKSKLTTRLAKSEPRQEKFSAPQKTTAKKVEKTVIRKPKSV